MNRNFKFRKSRDAAGLRSKEWMRLEDKIMELALAFWRRKGKAHLDALSAWRRAETEVLVGSGGQRPALGGSFRKVPKRRQGSGEGKKPANSRYRRRRSMAAKQGLPRRSLSGHY
jgi:hypothetical protein